MYWFVTENCNFTLHPFTRTFTTSGPRIFFILGFQTFSGFFYIKLKSVVCPPGPEFLITFSIASVFHPSFSTQRISPFPKHSSIHSTFFYIPPSESTSTMLLSLEHNRKMNFPGHFVFTSHPCCIFKDHRHLNINREQLLDICATSHLQLHMYLPILVCMDLLFRGWGVMFLFYFPQCRGVFFSPV